MMDLNVLQACPSSSLAAASPRSTRCQRPPASMSSCAHSLCRKKLATLKEVQPVVSGSSETAWCFGRISNTAMWLLCISTKTGVLQILWAYLHQPCAFGRRFRCFRHQPEFTSNVQLSSWPYFAAMYNGVTPSTLLLSTVAWLCNGSFATFYVSLCTANPSDVSFSRIVCASKYSLQRYLWNITSAVSAKSPSAHVCAALNPLLALASWIAHLAASLRPAPTVLPALVILKRCGHTSSCIKNASAQGTFTYVFFC